MFTITSEIRFKTLKNAKKTTKSLMQINKRFHIAKNSVIDMLVDLLVPTAKSNQQSSPMSVAFGSECQNT